MSSVIFGLWIAPTVGYVVGGNGMILRLDRHCAATETDCANRWDDDCDGKLNCADSDCAGNSYCTGGGICSTPATLACGAMLSGTTVGAAPTLERYACSPRLDSGGEVIYKLTAANAGNVSVTLTGDGMADLDLVVLAADANGGCEPLSTCVTASATASATETVSFTATAGATYFIIVDGYQGAAGAYAIAVSCS
jgi:hypothetical protein